VNSTQHAIISSHSTTPNRQDAFANGSTTSSICNSTILLPLPSTLGRTTAAITPSQVFQGVDVVQYEAIVDEPQLQSSERGVVRKLLF
jgi:hypothetical protein